MKKFLVLVTIILCVGAIIAGNIHWKHKISAQSKIGQDTKNSDSVVEEQQDETENNDLSIYSSKLPKNIQEKIMNAVSSGQPLQLVIYGSDATSESKGAWPDQFKKQLLATYGENVFNITVLTEGNQTTLDVVKGKTYEEINNLKPDIILFEPFMLNDNGLIGISNTLVNIEKMMDSWKKANKDVIILIQPPNPLYAAKFYPKEVEELAGYAQKYNIVYLNHWENWPELNDKTMEDYLTEQSNPNENGNKVWADYLINYFIAK